MNTPSWNDLYNQFFEALSTVGKVPVTLVACFRAKTMTGAEQTKIFDRVVGGVGSQILYGRVTIKRQQALVSRFFSTTEDDKEPFKAIESVFRNAGAVVAAKHPTKSVDASPEALWTAFVFNTLWGSPYVVDCGYFGFIREPIRASMEACRRMALYASSSVQSVKAGACQKPESSETDPPVDESAFVGISTLYRDRFNSLTTCKRFLEKTPSIRTRKPAKNRLRVHSGDWHRHWEEHDRKAFEALDTIEDEKAAARQEKAREVQRK